MRRFRFVALVSLLLAFVIPFLMLAPVATAQSTVTIAADLVNVRSAPSTDAAIVTTVSRGDVVEVVGTVIGEDVFGGNSVWYQTANGNFIYSALTGPSAGVTLASAGEGSGRWIEVDHATSTAYAIEDGQIVYSAPVTLGTAQFPTPRGTFQIIRRVANETMDSSTIGIPNNSPGGYYLTGVLYTQYFTNGGAALHYNYWSPPEAFGSAAGSHGCVGMRLADAAFFWNFATIGTPVIIH